MSPIGDISQIATMSSGEFEQVCRANTSTMYMGENRILCRVLSKYKLYADTRDTSIAPHLAMDGYWETWLTQCMARIVKPGDTCIDIGANLGYYSILMSALAGKKGRTIAIEPNPSICQLLKITAGLNVPGFQTVEKALSNKAAKLALQIPGDAFGDASIIDRSDRLLFKKTKVRVEAITLDGLLEQMGIRHVDVIKMDVEGAEPMVFEGMQNLVADNPGLKILLEYTPFLYKDPRAFTEYLFSHFIVHRIKDVDEMKKLDKSAMATLLQLNDHTDLFLQVKPVGA